MNIDERNFDRIFMPIYDITMSVWRRENGVQCVRYVCSRMGNVLWKVTQLHLSVSPVTYHCAHRHDFTASGYFTQQTTSVIFLDSPIPTKNAPLHFFVIRLDTHRRSYNVKVKKVHKKRLALKY